LQAQNGLDADIFRIYISGMAAKKKNRGRPVKTTGTKSEAILLRLAKDEKAGFTDAALTAGLPLAIWMRQRLREIAASELRNVGKSVPWA
jgi:hypothetical protein